MAKNSLGGTTLNLKTLIKKSYFRALVALKQESGNVASQC